MRHALAVEVPGRRFPDAPAARVWLPAQSGGVAGADKTIASPFHDPEVIENPVKSRVGAKSAPPILRLAGPGVPEGIGPRPCTESFAARANTPALP